MPESIVRKAHKLFSKAGQKYFEKKREKALGEEDPLKERKREFDADIGISKIVSPVILKKEEQDKYLTDRDTKDLTPVKPFKITTTLDKKEASKLAKIFKLMQKKVWRTGEPGEGSIREAYGQVFQGRIINGKPMWVQLGSEKKLAGTHPDDLIKIKGRVIPQPESKSIGDIL